MGFCFQKRFNGGRALANAFKPVMHRREIGKVDTLALMGIHPRPAGDIGDAVVIAAKPGTLAKAPIEHAIQALRFHLIALNGVGHRLRSKVVEVMILSEHRPQPADLPE